MTIEYKSYTRYSVPLTEIYENYREIYMTVLWLFEWGVCVCVKPIKLFFLRVSQDCLAFRCKFWIWIRPSLCNIFKVLPKVLFLCDIPLTQQTHRTRKFFFCMLDSSAWKTGGKKCLCTILWSPTRNRWTEHDMNQKLPNEKEWNYSNYDKRKALEQWATMLKQIFLHIRQ